MLVPRLGSVQQLPGLYTVCCKQLKDHQQWCFEQSLAKYANATMNEVIGREGTVYWILGCVDRK